MLSPTVTADPINPPRWPDKGSAATLDYSFDFGPAVNPRRDFVLLASLAVAPHGAGELTPSNLIVNPDNTLTVTMTGGQPGANYLALITLNCSDGRIYQFVINQHVSRRLEGYPSYLPPSPGYGAQVDWIFAPSLDFSNPLNSGMAAALVGI